MSKATQARLEELPITCPSWCEYKGPGAHEKDMPTDRQHYGPHHEATSSIERTVFDAYARQWAHGGDAVIVVCRDERSEVRLTLGEARGLAAALLAAVDDVEGVSL